MNTEKAKKTITLALDTVAMRGRFSVRDVAEKALREIKYEGLSEADKRECMMNFLMREAKTQMKAPLRQDFKEEQIKKLNPKYWPLLEKLTRTICVSSGHGAYHVMTVLATPDDWAAFLDMADVMEARSRTAKDVGRDIRDLLRSEGRENLWEILTGQKTHRIALKKNAA